jgi:hypothetical protein
MPVSPARPIVSCARILASALMLPVQSAKADFVLSQPGFQPGSDRVPPALFRSPSPA